jgi:hypothetical protein
MLEKIVVIALLVWSVHVIFWDGMILGSVSRWLSYRVPPKLQFPMYACAICMTPWYGSAIYWIVWHHSVLDWLVCTFAAMGLNAVISSFIPKETEPPSHSSN